MRTSNTKRRTLRVSLIGTQTLADAAPIGMHPVGTPQARTAMLIDAVPGLGTRPVEKDKPPSTRRTRPVDIRRAVALRDAVRRVEGDSTTVTLLADGPVGNGAVLWCTPRAVLVDDILVAPDARLGVTEFA